MQYVYVNVFYLDALSPKNLLKLTSSHASGLCLSDLHRLLKIETPAADPLQQRYTTQRREQDWTGVMSGLLRVCFHSVLQYSIPGSASEACLLW